jgi:hypothetical protein
VRKVALVELTYRQLEHSNMKILSQAIYVVTALALAEHCAHVESYFFDFDIVGRITDTLHKVLLPGHKQQAASTPLPTLQPLPQGAPTSIPASPPTSAQQREAPPPPQDPANGTVQDALQSRAMIDAPLINGQCEAGYRMTNGRCRKVFGRRRRRR